MHCRPTNRFYVLPVLLSGFFWLGTPCTRAEPATLPATLPSNSVEGNEQLPSDPANVRGQFDNGFHYLIRHNTNPPGKVYFDLAVRTGSLNETAEQNGLAHFLEHMAFKGSTHFAPTRLIPMLTHLGMQFGADTNAHTNRYETVFKLTMPDTKPETTNLALTIFSDYANGLSLFPIQIESERRVILEEMRSRSGLARREDTAENNQLFPGSRFAIHDVLGDPEIIKNAQAPLFVSYWNAWYRPENMTLVVVGDIDPSAIIAQAKPLLGTFTARVPASPPMKAGFKPFDVEKAIVLSDPERVAGAVEFESIQPARPTMTTIAQLRQQMLEDLAEAMVNRRFSEMISKGGAPFQSAEVSTGDVLRDGFLTEASATSEPQDWTKALGGMIEQLKLAVHDGFTQHEWDLIRNAELSGLQQAVKEESTLSSAGLVSALATAVDTDLPLQSAQQNLDLFRHIITTITLNDLKNAFAADFATGTRAYILKLPAATEASPLPDSKELLAAANVDWQKPIEATASAAQADSLLPEKPEPGKVAQRDSDADLKLTNVMFDNGVILHHRFSDYEKSHVSVAIVLPGGVLEETKENHGISTAASLIIKQPATSRLSSLQIRDLFSNKNVSVAGGIGLDSLSISVSGSPTDLPLGLQLVNAILNDGKLEEPALDRWKEAELQSLRGKPMSASAQLADAAAATVSGGDVRFAPLTADNVRWQQCTTAQAWFDRIARHSAIEITVVGDISADDAIALIASYFGSLPKRTGSFSDLDSLRSLNRDNGPYARTVRYRSAEPKAVVFSGFVGCDEHDLVRRPLALAALVMTERMIQKIRFEQQLVYSISCNSNPGSGVRGTGLITVSTTTDPQNAARLCDLIHSMFKDFATSGPTEDELATAKKQLANSLISRMKEPAFWLGQFAELQYHHRSLAELKQVPDVFQTFTSAQVRDAMRQFATDDRAIRFEVLPNDSATSAPATTQSAGLPNGVPSDIR